MKIRQGFVSNSSSSSFIINYDNKCAQEFTIEQIEDILLDMIKIHNKIENSNLTFNDVFDDAHIICYDEIERKIEYEIDNRSRNRTNPEKIKNKIIINSADENSVPHSIIDFMENALDAKYWHWG